MVVDTVLKMTLVYPCRHDKYFHFGLKFWFHVSWVFVVLIVTAEHYTFVRNVRTYFLAVALITCIQERADASLSRGVQRIVMALIAGTLGTTLLS